MPVPKGVRTRVTPDWFSYYLSTGGTFVDVSPALHFLYTSLFNNSTRGQYLHVFGMFPVASDSTIAPVYMVKEPLGVLQNNCSRINPDVGAPPGQIYFFDNGVSAITDPIFSVLAVAFAGGSIQGVPMFIVPTGYSLVVGGNSADSSAGCGFWYIPMSDARGVNAQ